MLPGAVATSWQSRAAGCGVENPYPSNRCLENHLNCDLALLSLIGGSAELRLLGVSPMRSRKISDESHDYQSVYLSTVRQSRVDSGFQWKKKTFSNQFMIVQGLECSGGQI